MTREIRLGVVGLGSRGCGMFGRAVKDMDNITPAALCDNDSERLGKGAEAHPEAAVFEDFEAMLASRTIDALLVETPATCHADFCTRALEEDVHVMSDIPPVASVEEANRLWDAERKSQALFMTGANPNMCAWIDTVIDMRRKGLLGDPYYIECEYIHDCRGLWPKTPWRKTYEPILYCTHDLGPVLRIIDEDFEWVTCCDTGSHVNREDGQHDAMAALLRTRSNIVVRFLASFINNRPQASHQIRMYTTRGYFEAVPPYLAQGDAHFVFYSTELPGLQGATPLKIASCPDKYRKFAASGHGGLDHALLDKFFDAIRQGKPSPIPAREGIRMSLPGIFAAESARRGGEPMNIRYPWTGDES